MYEIIRDRIILNKDQYNRIYEKDLEIILGKLFHIPKNFRHIIIEELMMLDYITIDELHNHKRIFKVSCPSH